MWESIYIEQLDTPFTVTEINETISSLKRNKSLDLNNSVADFFADAYEFICLIYVKFLILYIYKLGIYTEAWCKGITVPIHKNGDL